MLSGGDLRLVLSAPGGGGRQIIAEDPSGDPVELFEPALPGAKLG
jgi:hypothetical protein